MIERRAFGRTVLVGSHVVSHMLRFILRAHEDPPKEEGEEEETVDLVPKGPKGKGPSFPLRATRQKPLSSPVEMAPGDPPVGHGV